MSSWADSGGKSFPHLFKEKWHQLSPASKKKEETPVINLLCERRRMTNSEVSQLSSTNGATVINLPSLSSGCPEEELESSTSGPVPLIISWGCVLLLFRERVK